MKDLILKYEVEAVCEDCGEDIEEAHYYNDKGQPVHVTSATYGHYYLDGTARCEGCHDGSR